MAKRVPLRQRAARVRDADFTTTWLPSSLLLIWVAEPPSVCDDIEAIKREASFDDSDMLITQSGFDFTSRGRTEWTSDDLAQHQVVAEVGEV